MNHDFCQSDLSSTIPGKPIQELDSRAVALLMGCSSGKIKHTPIGGTGTPVEYMLSGCPAVLGYLWNITDRDCDRSVGNWNVLLFYGVGVPCRHNV